MKISVSIEIACPAPTAWRAMHRTAVIASVYAPLLRMESSDPMPAQLAGGDRIEVQLRALSLLPVGRQVIAIRDEVLDETGVGVRTMHDLGGPLSGPLMLARTWHHQMSVAQVSGDPGRTMWVDTLRITGPCVWLLGPVLWASWRLRAIRIKALARGW